MKEPSPKKCGQVRLDVPKKQQRRKKKVGRAERGVEENRTGGGRQRTSKKRKHGRTLRVHRGKKRNLQLKRQSKRKGNSFRAAHGPTPQGGQLKKVPWNKEVGVLQQLQKRPLQQKKQEKKRVTASHVGRPAQGLGGGKKKKQSLKKRSRDRRKRKSKGGPFFQRSGRKKGEREKHPNNRSLSEPGRTAEGKKKPSGGGGAFFPKHIEEKNLYGGSEKKKRMRN